MCPADHISYIGIESISTYADKTATVLALFTTSPVLSGIIGTIGPITSRYQAV